jgi:histidinol-phosphate phosphatase family protein
VSRRRALFLDRDGTLIADVGYPRDPAQVTLVPGAAAALRALPAGVARVIVTNQSGLGRGLIAPAEAAAVAAAVVARFAAEGVHFDGVYTCPHHPDDGCPCRKPAPGLLVQAAAELDLDLGGSIMIGDKPSDVVAGRAAGCAASLRLALGDDGDGDRDADAVGWNAAGRRIASLFGLE